MMDTKETAARLGVNVRRVRRWILSRELLATNLSTGKRPRWYVAQADLDAFLAARRNDTPDQAARPRRRKRRQDAAEAVEKMDRTVAGYRKPRSPSR